MRRDRVNTFLVLAARLPAHGAKDHFAIRSGSYADAGSLVVSRLRSSGELRMNTQIEVPDSTSELRILTDDEVDLVNGGSIWDYLLSAGSFVMTCALFGLVGWIANIRRP
jgi:hypothetical protein